MGTVGTPPPIGTFSTYPDNGSGVNSLGQDFYDSGVIATDNAIDNSTANPNVFTTLDIGESGTGETGENGVPLDGIDLGARAVNASGRQIWDEGTGDWQEGTGYDSNGNYDHAQYQHLVPYIDTNKNGQVDSGELYHAQTFDGILEGYGTDSENGFLDQDEFIIYGLSEEGADNAGNNDGIVTKEERDQYAELVEVASADPQGQEAERFDEAASSARNTYFRTQNQTELDPESDQPIRLRQEADETAFNVDQVYDFQDVFANNFGQETRRTESEPTTGGNDTNTDPDTTDQQQQWELLIQFLDNIINNLFPPEVANQIDIYDIFGIPRPGDSEGNEGNGRNDLTTRRV